MLIPQKPKSKSKNKRDYFTTETEEAIIEYNNNIDPVIKSKIYDERIHYAFFKLTENIIHTFKFHHTDSDSITDFQQEIIIFLLSKIHRFDPNNGAKAYSYFGTIVKRYCIIATQKNYKKKIKKIPVEELDQSSEHASNIELVDVSIERLSKFMDRYVEYCMENIFCLFPESEDSKIAEAILVLFKRRDKLEIFNKKALYIHIRESVDVKTPKITKIADKLYKIFKNSYLFYQENGYIKF